MYTLRIFILLFVILPIFPVPQPLYAQGESGVTSPTSGAAVSGDVPILGTAVIEPFQKYELYFKQEPSGDDAYIWFAGGTAPVVNGQLGVWQAAGLPAGQYSIRLRVVKNDGNYAEFFARDLRLNLEAAATPTTTPTETPAGPIPTPIPSATFTPAPQPTVALGEVTLPQAGAAPPDTPTPEPIAAVEPAPEQAASADSSAETASADSGGEVVSAGGQVADPAADEIESNSITRQLGEALAFTRLRTQFFNGVRYSAALFLVVGVIFLGKRAFSWTRARLY